MLTRRSEIASPDKYYSDSLLSVPSLGKSAYDNLSAGFATSTIAANILDDQYSKTPEGKSALSLLNQVKLQNETPGIGWGQWLVNEGANMLGFGLNPITWGLGEAGSFVAQGATKIASKLAPDAATILMRKPLQELISKPIGEYIPEKIGKEGAEKTLSLGLLSEKTLNTFGTFAGAGVPQGIVDNFNQDTNHINWGGVAREAGEMGAFGLAIGSIPFAYGVLKGKINRALGKSADAVVDASPLQEAFEKGHITKDEFEWYSDYLDVNKNYSGEITLYRGEDKNTEGGIWWTKNLDQAKNYAKLKEGKIFSVHVTSEDLSKLFEEIDSGTLNHHYKFIGSETELQEKINKKRYLHDEEKMNNLKNRASEIINKNGHIANTVSNEAVFDIIPANDINNLQGLIADQLVGNVPEQYKSALTDFVIHNSIDNHGKNPTSLDGVRGYVEFINEKMKAKDTKFAEANKILEDHLTLKVKENMPFSQKEIFKHMKQAGFEASHVQNLPMVIPENITRYLKFDEKINKLERKVRKEERRGIEPNKQTLKRIEDLRKQLPEIMTPKQELEHIKKTLLDKGLPNDFDRTNAYHRLLDLSNVWHNARTLLDRIHLEHEYNRQEAFKDLANQILKITDSNLGILSKPENVVDYLSKRIEGNLNKVESVPEMKKSVDEQQKIPTDADQVLQAQEEKFNETVAEEMKKEFDHSANRYKEFKGSEGIFQNLISCILGKVNG